jgi:excisionase family DNA binding protein
MVTNAELRNILADALEGAAQQVRGGPYPHEPLDATADESTDTNPALASGRATLSIAEAAQTLGVSRGSVYEAIRAHDLPVLRLGRRTLIPTDALNAWIKGSTGAWRPTPER